MDRPAVTAAAPPIVYLHGLPGTSAELAFFENIPPQVFAPDLRDGPLIDQVTTRFGDQPICLWAFSLGAFRALRFAAQWPERVTHLHLIAPAPPLDLGDFLGAMAGGPIFRLASTRPKAFRAITRIQAFAARWAPDMVARMMFASAQGADRILAGSARFRRLWAAQARDSLSQGAPAYCAEISAYVAPWGALLSKIQTPVSLYYGVQDSWVPADAVLTLARALPAPPKLNRFEQAGHYTTLEAALAMLRSSNETSLGDQSAFS